MNVFYDVLEARWPGEMISGHPEKVLAGILEFANAHRVVEFCFSANNDIRVIGLHKNNSMLAQEVSK